MEVEQLTDEQIANLTREQIEMLENDPDQLIEILGSKPASGETGNEKPERREEANLRFPATRKGNMNRLSSTRAGRE